jgi:hypothetical protein
MTAACGGSDAIGLLNCGTTCTRTAGVLGDYGPATAAQLSAPFDVACTPSGHLVIADTENDAVRWMW